MGGIVVLLLAFATLAVISWLSVGAALALAVRYNILDVPNERSSHSRPMPVCGGLAIVFVSIVAFALFAVIHHATTRDHVLVFIAGSLLIAAVSLVDDLGHVPYSIRLAVHGVAAVIFMVGYAYWHAVSIPLLGTIALGGFGIILTFLWIVGLTNAFNFMDGVDGMAAGQAVVAGLGWAALGWLRDWPLLETTGLLLAATSLGFLVHNWHPAKIFMGDVGSTFLGYSFAVLGIVAARYDARLTLAGVLLVWPTIFDTGFTIVNRLRRRENIFTGHREFLFHRLVAAGWSHSQAASLYLTLPILGAALAFTWDRGTPLLHLGIAMLLVGLCLSLWLLVRQQERKAPVQAALDRMLSEGRHVAVASTMASFRPGRSASLVPERANGSAAQPALGPATFGIWDGVERRSGRDRRRGQDRRSQSRGGPDRRTNWGRRVTDGPAASGRPGFRLSAS